MMVQKLDSMPLTYMSTQVEPAIQGDRQSPFDIDASLQNETFDQLPKFEMLPDILFRKSIRDSHPSTCYSTNEYVLMTDR